MPPRRTFGSTWWGEAWVGALEGRAGLDAGRLSRGRTYARQDRVARLEVEPGRIASLVRGSRVLPYQVSVKVPTFDDATWERVVAAIAGRAAHAAALLDGELEPGILEDLRAAGIELLPGPGDLVPRCSCPDWGDPCKHAAATCYLVADALDADPFVLLLLRGRRRDQVLAAVRGARRGSVGSAAAPSSAGAGASTEDRDVAAATVDPGLVAREAWHRVPAPPPDRRHPPTEPGTPAAWPADPPPGAPFRAASLTDLAADAARRAWAQLADGAPSGLHLGAAADLARRAADRQDRGDPLSDLATAARVSPSVLADRAEAWRAAGPAGVEALEAPMWRPTPDVAARALAAFDEVGLDRDDVRVRSNRFTYGDVQLRATADGRWWRYERRGTTWHLAEPPADDPAELLSGA